MFFFLGAASGAVASAFFCWLAVQAGDKGLARITAAAFVVCCVASLLLVRAI